MTIDILIMFSGALIALIPFLGFPLAWDNVILVILGIFVITLGVIVRRDGFIRRNPSLKNKTTASVEQTAHGEGEAHEA